MAKRSPILGYNHNVRYRGVIFHVQTEDSGVLSPHLFTHLFHEGVIVSTRKLVYDAGASPEAIKALMQSQHKAVLKELNKGVFDLKIDQYLAGTPGLEPRPAAAVASEPKASASVVPGAATAAGLDDESDSPGSAGARSTPAQGVRSLIDDSSDAPNVRRRAARDTAVDDKPALSSDPVIEDLPVAHNDSSPGSLPMVAQTPPRTTQPPAVARPIAPTRHSSDSNPVEIYAPALPAVEPPPSANSLVSGQYSLKRPTTNPVSSAASSSPTTVRGIDPPPTRPPTPPPTPPPVAQRNPTVHPPLALPRTATLPHRAALSQPPPTPPQAAKSANTTVPRMAAAPASQAVRPPTAGSNVVMTRPAVIVGAPAGAGSNRQRAAPEETVRPFGQALISEKSLDEVIHAYLSEDGEEL